MAVKVPPLRSEFHLLYGIGVVLCRVTLVKRCIARHLAAGDGDLDRQLRRVLRATAMPAPSVVEPLSLALTTSSGPLPTTSPPGHGERAGTHLDARVGALDRSALDGQRARTAARRCRCRLSTTAPSYTVAVVPPLLVVAFTVPFPWMAACRYVPCQRAVHVEGRALALDCDRRRHTSPPCTPAPMVSFDFVETLLQVAASVLPVTPKGAFEPSSTALIVPPLPRDRVDHVQFALCDTDRAGPAEDDVEPVEIEGDGALAVQHGLVGQGGVGEQREGAAVRARPPMPPRRCRTRRPCRRSPPPMRSAATRCTCRRRWHGRCSPARGRRGDRPRTCRPRPRPVQLLAVHGGRVGRPCRRT